MGLKEQAAADLRMFVEDETGFAALIVLTNPSGQTATVKGYTADIGITIDEETGLPVPGRRASAFLSLASLEAAGLGTPEQVKDQNSKPWRVSFKDSRGTDQSYKVSSTLPDLTLGALVCTLEYYR